MPFLYKMLTPSERRTRNGRSTIPLLVSTALFLFSQPVEAIQTSTYAFDPNQSTVVKTGGFAGVHETYSIEGQFELSIDFDASFASFEKVDANLTDEGGLLYTWSLSDIFNMTALPGTIVDDMTIRFEGKTDDGTESDVFLAVTFKSDSAHLTGTITPPANSADMFFYALQAVASRMYAGGTGEPNNPYQIATAEDLMLLGDSPEDYDKHFFLTADIDLDPNLPGRKVFNKAVIAPHLNPFDSWPFEGTSFTGVFGGNGHTISYLTIKGDYFLGLFGRLGSGAIISKVGLEAVDVSGTGMLVGGLVGWNEYGSITASYSAGTVTGDNSVGGLVGLNGHGSIAVSYSTVTITGDEFVGGLVGSNEYGCIIASYSTGKVAGFLHVGGLVGWNAGSIVASYSTGTATGFEYVGGLVGTSGGSIATSYSNGMASGDYSVGGLVGLAGYDSDFITSSFWDMETSGQTSSAGGMGLTTTEMQNINTYLNAGWDFVDEIRNGTCDYWQISPGDCPRLHYHFSESPVMPEGLGTAQQPYLIRDARDLGTVWLEPKAHYRLETSVDLSGTTWSMAVIPWFGGTLNGSGHTISHLTISGGSNLGLFGQLSEGTKVSNLGLEAVDIKGTGDTIGGLVGFNDNGNIITTYSSGTVTGYEHLGGLVGWNQYGSIIASYSTAKVTGTWDVGGLVGWVFEGSITSSYSTGMVSGDYHIGGLLGWNVYGSITDSYSTATTSGTEWEAGGLVGGNGGSISVSYSTGAVTGGKSVGGLVGWSGGSIAASYSTSAVTGGSPVGGMVGANGGSIATSYSSGMVKGDEDVGGLAGYNSGGITTSYSNGTVTGNGYVGGLVGKNRGGNITNSYSTGTTSGTDQNVGGLVGGIGGRFTMNYRNGSVRENERVGDLVGESDWGIISSSFWDTQTSGQATSAGGTGKTTVEMQTAGTFLEAGWDFVNETANGTEDIWWILEGQDYPKLTWELAKDDSTALGRVLAVR